MDLSIIILNINTKGFLRDCLSSLKESTILKEGSPYSMEIIVSDNGSSDGSVEMVKSEFPGVMLVENGENLGYAKDYIWSNKYVGPKTDVSFLPERLKNRKFFQP